MLRLRRLALGGHDTCRWQGLRGVGGRVYRPERLLPIVEERIERHRGACGCVAWIVCVLAVPWDVYLRLKVCELGSF